MENLIIEKTVTYTEKVFDLSKLKKGDKIHIKCTSVLPADYWLEYDTEIIDINEKEIAVIDDYWCDRPKYIDLESVEYGFVIIKNGWTDEE